MTAVSKEFTFDAAHRLQNHEGKCRRLHGHTYHVTLTFEGQPTDMPGTSSDGMVLDFDFIKRLWAPVMAQLDHMTILEHNDELLLCIPLGMVYSVPFPPTAEMLAQHIWLEVAAGLDPEETPNVRLMSVSVHETPTSWAVYP